MTLFGSIRRVNLKIYVIVFLSLLAVWEMARSGWGRGLPPLLVAIGSAALLDLVIHYFNQGRLFLPLSALVTGLLVGSILSPDERLWVVALAAAAAITSKHLIRIRGRHIFNPAIFGLLVASLLFHSPLVWWGSSNFWAVLVFGLVIAARFRRFHLLFAYAIPFALLMTWYARINDYPVWAHIMFLNFYFLVFMVVEPKTSPRRRNGRIIYGAATAGLTFFFFHVLPEYDAAVLGLATANLAVPALNYRAERKKIGRRTPSLPKTGGIKRTFSLI